MKNCSKSWRQSKSMIDCHFTPTKMTVIMKTGNCRCWQGCGEIETLIYFCIPEGCMQNGTAILQKVCLFLKELKSSLACKELRNQHLHTDKKKAELIEN